MKTTKMMAVVLTLFIAGCSTTQKSQNVKLATLNSQWELMELNGEAIITEAPLHITLSDDMSVYGFVGCNQMSGSYDTKGQNIIRFNNLISTRMACNDLSIEQNFLQALNNTDRYTIEGDNLYLGTERDSRMAVLKVMSTNGILNTRWVLEELNGKAIKKVEIQGNEAYFILKTNGKIIGYTGCNHFNGAYDLKKKQKIDFGKHMAVTLMACMDELINEHEFLQVFEQADSYTVDGELLTLKAKKKSLATFRAVSFK